MDTWDIWFPGGGATGLPFCRARIDHADSVWLHAAPRTLDVEVRDGGGVRLASAEDLQRSGGYVPMTKLTIRNGGVVRADGWPQPEDIGSVVLLPGGEAGILDAWWNAADGSEWRWSVTFYNRR